MTVSDPISPVRGNGSLAPSDWLLVPLSLILGLFLVPGGLLGYYLTGDRYLTKESIVWPGPPWALVTGEIEGNEKGLTIKRLDARGSAAVTLGPAHLNASRYARLRLETSGLGSKTRIGLAWRAATGGQNPQILWLPASASGGAIDLSLQDQPRWSGGVMGLTLLVQGELSGPLLVHRIALFPAPPGVTSLLGQMAGEWTVFTGWTHKSINFLTAGKRHGLISPVLAVALWIAASLLLYCIARGYWGGAWRLAPFVIITLTGWVVLDVRWQWDFLRQVETTYTQFAGKSPIEKRLAAEDRALFQLAQRTKEAVVGKPGRLWLLAPMDENRYRYLRIRLNYLLLPLNVSAHWSLPPAAGVRAGDHLFVWRGHAGIRWDARDGKVSWEGQDGLAAEKVLSTGDGDLFRIRG